MMMDDVLHTINKPNSKPGDYIGKDGLLYCGKCNTAKQTRIESVLSGEPLSIQCACDKAAADKEAERERLRKVEELRAACIPVAAMHKNRFDCASDAPHIKTARRYVAKWDEVYSKNIGLLLWGNTGTGKSYTAQCICNALVDRNIPVKYISAVELVAKLMDKDTKRGPFMDKLRNTPLLVIDDIGAERDTAFSREQICAVIDARSEAGRPLIVTTNLTLDEMERCADGALQRVYNRIKAMCVPVAVIGESRRDAIGAEKAKLARELLRDE